MPSCDTIRGDKKTMYAEKNGRIFVRQNRPATIGLILAGALFLLLGGYLPGGRTRAVYAANPPPVQTFFVPLPEGEVRLQLRAREDGTKIDRLLITADPDEVPH